MNEQLMYPTPIEHYPQYGLWVKREDLCVRDPFPAFSKCRGVVAHLLKRPEANIGVLDTYHSQAGQAVAAACLKLGKQCYNFYPVRKAERGLDLKPQQEKAAEMGAIMRPLQAGRSAILYHQARKALGELPDAYMMPNALKLQETIDETAAELLRMSKSVMFNAFPEMPILVAVSSATIGAGVLKGLKMAGLSNPVIFHMGYSRSHDQLLKYATREASAATKIILIDQGYTYGDKAPAAVKPEWPCNEYYDLKAFGWWLSDGRDQFGEALLWNIG